MTLIEQATQVYEDEKRTRLVKVRSFEIAGVELPHAKNVPVRISMTGQPVLYLSCSHVGADMYLGHPISFSSYVKLRWYSLWH